MNRVALGDITASKIQTVGRGFSGEISYIDISSIDSRRKKIVSTSIIDFSEAPSRAKQLVQRGDILVSTVRPNLNAVALVDREFGHVPVASTGYSILRPLKGYSSRYLFHFCQTKSFIDYLVSRATGASYPAVNNAIVRGCTIPDYSLSDQESIASRFDRLDSLISGLESESEKLNQLVKSRFVEMFGATSDGLLSGWESVDLAACVASIDTGSSPKCKAGPREGLGPGVLKLSALSSGSYLSSENKAMEEGAEIPSGKEVLQGDLLVARKNTPELVGACVLVDEPASNLMFPDLVFRMHPTEKVDGRYLVTLLANSPYSSEVRGLAHGTAKSMSNIPKSALSKLPIPIPPKTMQQEFAAFAAQVDKSRFAVQQAIEQLELLKAKLMQEYFG